MENFEYYKYFSGDNFNCGSDEQCDTQNNEFCDTKGLDGQDSTWKCFQRNDACIASCNPETTCNGHGSCNENGGCICDDTHTGSDCSSKYSLTIHLLIINHS